MTEEITICMFQCSKQYDMFQWKMPIRNISVRGGRMSAAKLFITDVEHKIGWEETNFPNFCALHIEGSRSRPDGLLSRLTSSCVDVNIKHHDVNFCALSIIGRLWNDYGTSCASFPINTGCVTNQCLLGRFKEINQPLVVIIVEW